MTPFAEFLNAGCSVLEQVTRSWFAGKAAQAAT